MATYHLHPTTLRNLRWTEGFFFFIGLSAAALSILIMGLGFLRDISALIVAGAFVLVAGLVLAFVVRPKVASDFATRAVHHGMLLQVGKERLTYDEVEFPASSIAHVLIARIDPSDAAKRSKQLTGTLAYVFSPDAVEYTLSPRVRQERVSGVNVSVLRLNLLDDPEAAVRDLGEFCDRHAIPAETVSGSVAVRDRREEIARGLQY